ncbi:TetR/AcrR family transcriptional regulator [Nocardia sp. NPDC059239]|uniref:TetR/AcrR family transcriptional regulator n=1 Tax=unclassified Nocardia TaxID=2637762 RepID=UPI0036C9660B
MTATERGRDHVPSPRVRRKQEAARVALIAAARALIAEKGVAGLRVRDVTAAANVGFGSFYGHFPDTAALVDAVFTEVVSELADRVFGAIGDEDDPVVVVSIAHRMFVRLATEDPQLARILVNLHHADELFGAAVAGYLRPILVHGVESGQFVADDFDTAVTFVAGATLAVVRSALAGTAVNHVEDASARLLLRTLGVVNTNRSRPTHRP